VFARKGELLCFRVHQTAALYKTNGPWASAKHCCRELRSAREQLASTRQRPVSRQRALGARPHLSGALHLQREILGFCSGGRKACEKAQASGKPRRGDRTTRSKYINRLLSVSRGNSKGCYQLKGDQRIFRLDVRNIFYPRPSLGVPLQTAWRRCVHPSLALRVR